MVLAWRAVRPTEQTRDSRCVLQLLSFVGHVPDRFHQVRLARKTEFAARGEGESICGGLASTQQLADCFSLSLCRQEDGMQASPQTLGLGRM